MLDAIFEPGLLEPSPLDFISFSSFSDLSMTSLPSSPSPNSTAKYDLIPRTESEYGTEAMIESVSIRPQSVDGSETSSPPSPQPFLIYTSSLEPHSPSSIVDFGIFHTPSKAGSSITSTLYSTPKNRTFSTNPTLTTSSSVPPQTAHSTRSSGSSESWGTPLTPSLQSSAEAFAAFANSSDLVSSSSSSSRPVPFSWEDAPHSLPSASSPFTPSPAVQAAHSALRVASNPTLGAAARNARAIKHITSMPALKEEDQLFPQTPSQWLDESAMAESSTPSSSLQPNETSGDSLMQDFNWVFNGLEQDDTIFDAFRQHAAEIEAATLAANASTELPSMGLEAGPDAQEMAWLFHPHDPDLGGTGSLSYDLPLKEMTINPMAVMAQHGADESQRPVSAPGAEASGMLSVPMADMMSRSLSSEGYVPTRHAPHRDLFSYTPQQIPCGPPAPQPLYTTEPSPSYNSLGPNHQPRLPPTPRSRRTSQHRQLSIQIHPPPHSSYLGGSLLPPTPVSANFADLRSQQAALPMARSGSQPLPHTRRMSGGYTDPISNGQIYRAQAYARMQENEDVGQHDFYHRHVSAPLHSAAMQPSLSHPGPRTMRWEGHHPDVHYSQHGHEQIQPSPVFTHTPLMNIHPPPSHHYYPIPPRVHPPPHPGLSQHRPIARLPSPKSRRISPNKRSPSGKRKHVPSGGTFSWGETTFINFTSDDAEKLLTGVAPSGSQSKRKREEEAARLGLGQSQNLDAQMRKRSKSGEC
ncbi:hypothetical protein TREMEDRAFT_74278 [Tremella mesenterica DSM 1558]|uniref:uncharacterized protein n=1 Tax=Tremella mesenterica (strain ATCC 24925 / CBS 8224 / DSM 1558 / NBRC 9311 / NRRL Y-6157 / RJB 2259-6 / UBC 559-6) TaxID=578456 RepID=UPI0003F4915C|nr:uncharacterized protein TREMEDRAFT_74278 [Tremella mesenterica DSM 1558]EIW68422.1 hypothetical protein TREMEDRAFT_74278 [Tremella mesenterica DSM 1558]